MTRPTCQLPSCLLASVLWPVICVAAPMGPFLLHATREQPQGVHATLCVPSPHPQLIQAIDDSGKGNSTRNSNIAEAEESVPALRAQVCLDMESHLLVLFLELRSPTRLPPAEPRGPPRTSILSPHLLPREFFFFFIDFSTSQVASSLIRAADNRCWVGR